MATIEWEPQFYTTVTKCQKQNNSEREKVSFGSQYQRVQSTVSWLCCFGAYDEEEHQWYHLTESQEVGGGLYIVQGRSPSDLTSSH